MALWPTRAARALDETRVTTRQSPNVSSLVIPTWSEQTSYGALIAEQVPAFSRALRLITGTVAQLPLFEWAGGTRVRLWDQIESQNPYWTTMQRTVEDLALYGRAYWQIAAVGVGITYRLIPAAEVEWDTRLGKYRYGTLELTRQNPDGDPTVGNVVEFTGYRDGVLVVGSEIITTGIALNRAARGYADVPAPSQILKNTSSYELSDDEITNLLAGYETARKNSTVAYVNSGVDLTTFGYTPEDMQLVDAINGNATQIARLFNLDPYWTGAAVPGSTLTYQNRVDARLDLVDLCLSDYIAPIEQRLSMPDLSGTNLVRFDTTEFTRSNLDARVAMVNTLVPLGVMSIDEARSFIADKPIPGGAYQ